MTEKVIVLRFGELTLKGKNQKHFVAQLVRNIKQKLIEFPALTYTKDHGRMLIELHSQDAEPVMEGLQEVFGLHAFTVAEKVVPELHEIQLATKRLLEQHTKEGGTFKVETKRADKRFPIDSQEMNRKLGTYLLQNSVNRKVDVHQPDVIIKVEIRTHGAYISGNDTHGPGGLPVGTSGKSLLLLSGGIDSPVAGYLALKRGVKLEAIHFHSYPFTSERAKQKVLDLAKHLAKYGTSVKVHVVPFTEIQTEINRHCYDAYSVTIMRRMMLRIAEAVARKRNALTLVTGESLGQVASQTMESMNTINAVTNYPILRPVVTMDKTEIMEVARRIGTYETSILPYEDCCTIFLPKNPKTRPTIESCEKQEAKFDWEPLVVQAVENIETIECKQEEEEFHYF
ncbi:tRNA uracil 4-sulfurtransferase ThiI [Risungbinella massiliensis]|uniref:tRNA uracil 4-sulfurtransferase ThiI n=1 Tax=Risungbinella massiliensis TaxID=1329796 RepID=UPI0005CC7FD3|nr:tRNA uracil 4-sulfurtransferase ThiI [Risungbinella massiliensis]